MATNEPGFSPRPSRRRGLSRRERDVLQLLAEGFPAKEIHDQLGLSIHTVNQHLHSAYRKLGVTNCREAVRWYWQQDYRRVSQNAASSPRPS